MKLFQKSTVLFLAMFFLLITTDGVLLNASIADLKNKYTFSGTHLSAYDDEEEEPNNSIDDEDSEEKNGSSDENTDDNSIDEYNYSDDD